MSQATQKEIEQNIAKSRARRASILPKHKLSPGEVHEAVKEIITLTGATHVHIEHHRKRKLAYKLRGKFSKSYVGVLVPESRGGSTFASVQLPTGTRVQVTAHCHTHDIFQKSYGYAEAVSRLLHTVKQIYTEV